MIFKKLFLLLILFVAAAETFAQPVRERLINVNFTDVKGKTNRFYREMVGAGRAAEALRANWQRDLKAVHDECGFRYIRFHGLLHDEMGVFTEDKKGMAVYNFQYIDAVFDAILNTGMKPFVEIGFMPEKLKSNEKTIFWWKGNISPPNDEEKWQNLVRALIRHWTTRYGEAEVAQWYFEIWNEPNLDFFFTGTQADYFKLYAATARAVKSVSPAYRVGGPATAGRAWITEMIDFAALNNLPLDFITTHDYGVRGVGFDEDGNQKLYLDTSKDAIIAGVREVKDKISRSQMPALPLHYTEWSSSYSARDPVHDSYVSAPYILSRLKGSEGFADSMSYWTFTDIFEENGTVPTPFHGGFGMINFQGLRKPSFYAYQFLNRLGDEELKSDDAESWTTRTPTGAQVLFWSYVPPETIESNQIFYKKDLPARAIGKTKIRLAELPAGNYNLKIYQIGYLVNDVYTEYLRIGAPVNLSRAQVQMLAQKTDGRPLEAARIRIKKEQAFEKEFEVRENDVFLVTIEKMK